MKEYTPMIKQYLDLKNEAKDAFLFFRLGDFYELFFEDAIKASKELEITLTHRDGGKEKVPMCGVPYHSYLNYVAKLIKKGYKVAICEQLEDASLKKGLVKRQITRYITPGTVIEEDILNADNNFLVSITNFENNFGFTAVDFSTGEVYLCPLSADDLLYELSFYNPKEIVIEKDILPTTVLKYLKTNKIIITKFKPPNFEENILKKHFPNFRNIASDTLLKEALFLVYTYLQSTQKGSLVHLSSLNIYKVKQYMQLDINAKNNLELVKSLRSSKKEGSLFFHLDKTKTTMGSRLLKKWLEKPLLDIQKIKERQQIITNFLKDFLLLDQTRDFLNEIYDLERLATRVSFGNANAKDLVFLKNSLQKIEDLKQLFKQNSFFNALVEDLDNCSDIIELIDNAITDDPPLTLKEGNIIKSGFSKELDDLNEIQRNCKLFIAKLEEEEKRKTGIKSLKINYNKVFGYYIEITKTNLKLVPKDRYIRKQTLANAERFITLELKEKEELILTASKKAFELEYDIFLKIRNKVGENILRLQKVSKWIAKIDCLQALAKVAQKYHYVCPKISKGFDLKITQARHPVIEALQKDSKFIANDVFFNNDKRILLITGPNMAGKSTYMRQIALIIIMAQIGSFVPAKEALISLTDKIFTRIGAVDDLTYGHSTFMVEMLETCKALNEATENSLILLDEVGRGTSTYDGMALAQAIIEYIHDNIGAKTLFSTHYHELTLLEKTLPFLANMHAQCQEEDDKITFLYKMADGGINKSYGIHVAKLAGLPKCLLTRAFELLKKFEKNNNVKEDVKKENKRLKFNNQEKEVLNKIRAWDLLKKTPLQTMQFLFSIQQDLKNCQVKTYEECIK